MAQFDDAWMRSAVAITTGFEVSGDPYRGVAGDFDGMGISCGALQWNIGQASLQPLVLKVGAKVVKREMPTLGAQLVEACNGSVAKGLSIVRGWQSGTKLNPTARKELAALMGSPEMRIVQDDFIRPVATRAFDSARAWADGKAPTKRLFCWFFDLRTQNGGLEGLTRKGVLDFIEKNSPDRADDLVCDFLAGQTGKGGAVKDGLANAKLWRGAQGDRLELLVASYLRSKTANPKWRVVVLNRKGTIAIGRGHVNLGSWDFAKHDL